MVLVLVLSLLSFSNVFGRAAEGFRDVKLTFHSKSERFADCSDPSFVAADIGRCVNEHIEGKIPCTTSKFVSFFIPGWLFVSSFSYQKRGKWSWARGCSLQ